MTLLNQRITYEQLISWGAANLYSEQHFRPWFGAEDSITVGQVLKLRTHASRIFWIIMREEILPPKLMHRMSIDMCLRFLDRLEGEGVYVDFRTRRVLDRGQAWLRGEISLGAYASARRKAAQALDDVSELENKLVSAGAHAACQAGLENARDAFRQVYYTVTEIFKSDEDMAEILRAVEKSLASYKERVAPAPRG